VIYIFRFCRVENLESENVTVRARIGKAERTREMYRNGNLVVDRKKNHRRLRRQITIVRDTMASLQLAKQARELTLSNKPARLYRRIIR
jgi:hypothetical protein